MTVEEILERSEALNAAQRRVDALVVHRDRSDADYAAWHSATQGMKSAFDRLYSDEFRDAYQALKSGDMTGADLAITYLEADPISFRSGYIKADLLKFLKRIPLDEGQSDRLRNVVLGVVESRPRREFRAYCRLAAAVDSPGLREALQERLMSPHPVARHAQWVLQALDGPHPTRHFRRCKRSRS